MSKKCCTFAVAKVKGEVFMSTFTLQIPTEQVGWFEQMIRSMGWVFSRSETPAASISNEHQVITPAMRRRINKARKEHAAGQTISCKTPEEMQQFFDNL